MYANLRQPNMRKINCLKTNSNVTYKYKYKYKKLRKTKVKAFRDESANKEMHAQSQQLALHPASIVNPKTSNLNKSDIFNISFT